MLRNDPFRKEKGSSLRNRPTMRVLFLLFSMTGTFLAFAGCESLVFKTDLEAIRARGRLRVITRNSATCYYEGPRGPMGFEYELSRAFAKYLRVELKLVVLSSRREMVEALLEGKADLIAAGLPSTKLMGRGLALGPGYYEVNQQVVGIRGAPAIKKIEDLAERPLWVGKGSTQEEVLKEMKLRYPGLSWKSAPGYDSEDLLEWVGQGRIALTVADSGTISVHRTYYPDLTVYLTIKSGQRLAWIMLRQNPHLIGAVYRWFSLPPTVSLLRKLRERYYDHAKNFDYVDLSVYHKRLRRRLPLYRKTFEAAARKYHLDWRLVAAQAYQESHWNPRAKSFTGVRGMMMLTLETAKDYGVKSRLDPKQMIHAGARHLARLHERVGDQVVEPDRTFMALAAYNVGWGHLEDARKLAKILKKNPDSWNDVRSVLPFLAQRKYYRSLPHGYARGREPVAYVDRIRTYYQILVRHLEKESLIQRNPGISHRH